jgi:hypothetical protein
VEFDARISKSSLSECGFGNSSVLSQLHIALRKPLHTTFPPPLILAFLCHIFSSIGKKMSTPRQLLLLVLLFLLLQSTICQILSVSKTTRPLCLPNSRGSPGTHSGAEAGHGKFLVPFFFFYRIVCIVMFNIIIYLLYNLQSIFFSFYF